MRESEGRVQLMLREGEVRGGCMSCRVETQLSSVTIPGDLGLVRGHSGKIGRKD